MDDIQQIRRQLKIKIEERQRQRLAARIERFRKMRELRESGMTLNAIGELYGISRQRVCQILQEQS